MDEVGKKFDELVETVQRQKLRHLEISTSVWTREATDECWELAERADRLARGLGVSTGELNGIALGVQRLLTH